MTITEPTDPKRFVAGYQLCASTEGKSPNSIVIVTNSVKYFQRFLSSHQSGMHLSDITRNEIRAFISYLQQMRCFATHPTNPIQEKGLSGHTINCYLRSLRIFYSWLVSEEIMEIHPFDKVKIPRPPSKVIPAFSSFQIKQLLNVINTKTTAGYRDFAIMLTLLDTGLRISELCSLKMEKLWLEDGIAKVLGKGNKERMIPIGKQLQRVLWRYIDHCRPKPTNINYSFVFLTQAGRPLTRRRVEKVMTDYGQKAKLEGIRCSPHTLRHTAAISFLRNGGDLFSLQRMLGHASLEMTRRYCELADTDVKKAHNIASPVDNLDFASVGGVYRVHGSKTLPPAQGDDGGNRSRHMPKRDIGGYNQELSSRWARIETQEAVQRQREQQ